MTVKDWSTTTTEALLDSWLRIVAFLPRLLGALVIIIIGVIVANLLRWVVERVIETLRLQTAFDELQFAKALKAARLNTNLARMAGVFVQWVVIILFLIPSVSVIGLGQVSSLLNDIIRYLPNVGVAVVVLFFGALLAEFIGSITRAAAAGLGAIAATSLAALSRYLIYVFAGLVALSQLGIASQVINILLTGFVAAAAIAFGLAFGLGGKDSANDLIAKIRRDFANPQR